MRSLLIRYISLLIFSGLTIPLYNTIVGGSSAPIYNKVCAKASDSLQKDPKSFGFSFFKDAVSDIFPVLKKLNPL